MDGADTMQALQSEIEALRRRVHELEPAANCAVDGREWSPGLLEIITHIHSKLVSGGPYEDIIEVAIRNLRRIVACERSSVILFDRVAKRMRILGVSHSAETTMRTSTDLSMDVMPEFLGLLDGEIQRLDDLRALRNPSILVAALKAEGIRSVLSVPLKAGDTVIGALNVGAEVAGAFSDEHVRITRAVADSLAIAVHLRQQYQSLAESHQKFSALAENSPNMIFITDGRHIKYANRRCEDMLGYSRDELCAADFEIGELFAPEVKAAGTAQFKRHEHGVEESVGELKLTTRKDTTIDVIVATRVIPYELDHAVLAIATDISARKRAELELTSSREQLWIILDSLNAAVYVADMETYELLYLNRYSQDIFGDVVGQKCWKALQHQQSGPCDFCTNKHLRSGDGLGDDGSYVWEFQNTVSGQWFSIRDRMIEWVDGRSARLEIALDITEHKRTEDEKDQHFRELELAMERIKQLSRLLPICAACKRIRDDKGQWHGLEAFIEAHSDTTFTHSICPACAKGLYDIDLP